MAKKSKDTATFTKEYEKHLKEVVKGKKQSNLQLQDEEVLLGGIADLEMQILKYQERILQTNQDINKASADYTKHLSDQIKYAAKYNTTGFIAYKTASDRAAQMAKTAQISKDVLKTEILSLDTAMQRHKKESDVLKEQVKQLEVAKELVSKYEESFEWVDKIDDMIKSLPGGAFLSKLLGTGKLRKEFEENIVKGLLKGDGPMKAMAKASGKFALNMAAVLPILVAFGAVVFFAKMLGEADKEASQLAKDLDISKSEALEVQKHSIEIAENMHMTKINATEVNKSIVALKDSYGTLVSQNEELVKNVTVLREKMGLTDEEAIKLNDTANLLGTNLDGLAMTVEATGGDLLGSKQTMKEMAKLSNDIVTRFKGTAQQLAKAVVKGKLFGLSLDKVVAAADKLLDFEGSITSEYEASVLLGKQLNLDKARQLALDNDLAGLQDELIKNLDTIGGFENMNAIERQKYAEAVGLSTEELSDMVAKSKQLAEAGLTASEAEEFMNKSLEEQQQTLAGLSDDKKKDYLENMYRQKSQSEAMGKLKDSFMKFAEAMSKTLLPVLDYLTKIANKVAEFVNWVNEAVPGLLKWAVIGGLLVLSVIKISKLFSGLRKNVSDVIGMFKAGSDSAQEMADATKTIAEKTPEALSAKGGDMSQVAGPQKGTGEKLGELGGGLEKMGTGKVTAGIGNLALFAIAGVLAIPAFAGLGILGLVAKFDLEGAFKSLANGLEALGKGKGIWTGILALTALGAAMIPFGFAMSFLADVDWKTLLMVGPTILILAASVMALGGMMASLIGGGIFFLGVVALASLGAALIPLGEAMGKMAPALPYFAKLMETLGTVQNLTDKTAEFFSSIAEGIYDISDALDDLDGEKLNSLATVTSLGPRSESNNFTRSKSTSSDTTSNTSGDMKEVAQLLKQLINKVSGPTKIVIGNQILDVITEETGIRRNYTIEAGKSYGNLKS